MNLVTARRPLGGRLVASITVAQEAQPEPGGYRFTKVSDIQATPVPNQQRAGTCWSYASGGFVEAEMLRMGKPPEALLPPLLRGDV